MTKAYDRKLKNESEKNFHRFEVFRDLGPARKYKDAAKILNNEISKNIQKDQTVYSKPRKPMEKKIKNGSKNLRYIGLPPPLLRISTIFTVFVSPKST